MAKARKATRADIKKLTDSRSWQRGVNYYNNGHVQSLIVDGNEITARVSGNTKYKVILQVSGSHFDGDCNCPMGVGGYFCKHCVAASLAYIDGKGTSQSVQTKNSKKINSQKITISDILKHLNSKDKKELVNMLIEQVKDNDRFRENLMFELALGPKDEINLEVLYALVDRAYNAYSEYEVDFDYRYDYQDMSHCIEQAENAVVAIDDYLNQNQRDGIIELIEYAIDKLQSTNAYVYNYDDDLYCLIEQLADMHLKACKKIRPEPLEFAEHLLTLSLHEGDTFCDAYNSYSSVLGKKGKQHFQQLLFKQWEKLPALDKGNRDKESLSRNRITSLMEDIAKKNNDLDLLVAIKSKDLTRPWDYLKIAELYKKHRKRTQSFEWIQKAIKVFGRKECHGNVAMFLAEEYCYKKQYKKALEVIWHEFVECCNLEKYKVLKKYSDKCDQWKNWRHKAIDYINSKIQKEKSRRKRNIWGPSGHKYSSVLVEIFLWEKTPEKAWQQAKTGGCSRQQLLKLAKLREEKHPTDAIQVYQDEVNILVGQTNNDAYKEAAGYIKKLKKLMTKNNKPKQYQDYHTNLNVEFKRKRNFIKLLAKI